MMNYYILTFHQLTDALYYEELFKNKELKGRVIPVPRQISSSCGLSIKTEEDINNILKLVENERDKPNEIYSYNDGNYKKIKAY